MVLQIEKTNETRWFFRFRKEIFPVLHDVSKRTLNEKKV